MLIEQNIKFQLRGPGSPNRTCAPNKKKIFGWIILYGKNIARGNAPYFPTIWPNKSLTIEIQQHIAG